MKLFTAVAICVVLASAASGCSSSTERKVAPVHWDLSAIVNPAMLTISAYIGSSSCSAFDSFNVVETDDQVDITVLASNKLADACTADMRIETIDVALGAPLGERELTGCLPFERAPGQPDLGCRLVVPYP